MEKDKVTYWGGIATTSSGETKTTRNIIYQTEVLRLWEGDPAYLVTGDGENGSLIYWGLISDLSREKVSRLIANKDTDRFFLDEKSAKEYFTPKKDEFVSLTDRHVWIGQHGVNFYKSCILMRGESPTPVLTLTEDELISVWQAYQRFK